VQQRQKPFLLVVRNLSNDRRASTPTCLPPVILVHHTFFLPILLNICNHQHNPCKPKTLPVQANEKKENSKRSKHVAE
jgi:hypothetical protein